MTKSTITRERIQRIIRAINSEAYDEEEIREWLSSDEIMELSRMALAAMDSSESVELPLDYLQGHKDGLEWAAQLAEANHPETGDWLYDDPIELAKAIRKGPDMPPVQPVADSEPVIVVGDDGGDALSYRRLIQSFEPGTKLYRHAQPAPEAYATDWESCRARAGRSGTTPVIGLSLVSIARRTAGLLRQLDFKPNQESENPIEVLLFDAEKVESDIKEMKKNRATMLRPHSVCRCFYAPARTLPDKMTAIVKDEAEFVEGWNACRAAMLQASPVCTCHSGDGFLRWPCPVHHGNSPAQSDCCPAQNSVNPAQGGNYLVIPDEMTSEQAYEIGYYYGDPVDVFARGANWMRQHIIDSTLAAAPQSPGSGPATVPGKWIPVSERMPEIRKGWLDTPVIIAVLGEKDGAEAMYCSDGKFRWGRDEQPIDDVTHWMPLPEAPKEVKGE